MLGIMQTAAWTSYFAVAGIGRETALHLMPAVGAFDVAMALLVLIRPIRGMVLYMAIWCVCTALLRPLAGESFWEAVERAGNYGAPLALFLLMRNDGVNSWLGGSFHEFLDKAQSRALGWVLRLGTVMLLLGHGALGLIVRKPVFSAQYSVLGLPGATIVSLVSAVSNACSRWRCCSNPTGGYGWASLRGNSRRKRSRRWPDRRSGSSSNMAAATQHRSHSHFYWRKIARL
jgi:hypothetical protein